MYFHDYLRDPELEYWEQQIYPPDVVLTELSDNEDEGDQNKIRPQFKRFGESKDFEQHQHPTLAKCQFCGYKGWTSV